jgi:hypothetical protein
MVKVWRPLTQKELPDLSSGDTVVLRQNYLYNPEQLPVAYVKAICLEKLKREGTFMLEGSDEAILSSLTEVGRYVDTGWHMTGDELSRLKSQDPISIHKDSGERRQARFLTGASPYTAKVILDGDTEPTTVILRLIGPANFVLLNE